MAGPVGLIGLGARGGPMARNTAAAGLEVFAFDIAGTAERAPEGARAAGAPLGLDRPRPPDWGGTPSGPGAIGISALVFGSPVWAQCDPGTRRQREDALSTARRGNLPYGIEPGIVGRIPDELFAGLEERIRELHVLRPGRRARDFVFYALLWLVGAVVVVAEMRAGDALWLVLGTVLAALGLNGFVLLVHEGMHGTLLASGRATRAVSVLLSCTHLLSFTAYQVLHIRHHKHVGTAGDPDHYENYVARKSTLWLMHGARLAAASFLYLVAIPALAWRGGSRAVRRRLLEEYAVLAALAIPVALWIPGDVLLRTWLVPMLLVAAITQVRAFAQHTLTDPSEPLLAARSMRPLPAVSYLMLHENYHLEHHLLPRVPSYNLPELGRLLEPRLPRRVVGSSYLALVARFLWAARTMDETPVVIREREPELASPEQVRPGLITRELIAHEQVIRKRDAAPGG